MQVQSTFKKSKTASVLSAGNGKTPATKIHQASKKRAAPNSTPAFASKSVPQKISANMAMKRIMPNRKEPKRRKAQKKFFTP